MNKKSKQKAMGQEAIQDLLFLMRSSTTGATEEQVTALEECYLDGERIAELLRVNFSRLAQGAEGITKERLSKALVQPDNFSDDEYIMLQLLVKYFDTIANMCEDEPGPQTMITSLDATVLCQFLVHSKLSLAELHNWREMSISTSDEDHGLPPLSS